jgi:AcrR family transcriptional regulator
MIGKDQNEVASPDTPEGKPQAILDTAARLFAEQGFQKTSVDDIARLAGVSTGTVYYYYKSKSLLLQAVQLRSVEAWTQATRNAARGEADSRAARIAAGLRASAAYAMKDPVMRLILMHDPRVFPLHNQKIREAIAESIDMKPSLLLGVKNGEIRSDLDIENLAAALRLIHDAMIRELFASPEWARPVDDTARIEAVIDVILHGILVGPDPQ